MTGYSEVIPVQIPSSHSTCRGFALDGQNHMFLHAPNHGIPDDWLVLTDSLELGFLSAAPSNFLLRSGSAYRAALANTKRGLLHKKQKIYFAGIPARPPGGPHTGGSGDFDSLPPCASEFLFSQASYLQSLARESLRDDLWSTADPIR